MGMYGFAKKGFGGINAVYIKIEYGELERRYN